MYRLLSWYSLKLPVLLVYMLQQVEYDVRAYLQWVWRLTTTGKSIRSVMYRKSLVYTGKARFLIGSTYAISALLVLMVPWTLKVNGFTLSDGILALSVIVFIPVITIFYLTAISSLAWFLLVRPSQKRQVKKSAELFRHFNGIVIGVAGSYGKTTMKEILATVLGEGLKVDVTPGNMNTPVAHARFAKKLKDQEVAIIEYGEGSPGDIRRFAEITHPDYAVITGLAPNHLDKYKTFSALKADLLSLHDFVESTRLYINADNDLLNSELRDGDIAFSIHGAADWTVSNIKVATSGISFLMKNKTKLVNVKSKLLGSHQVAPLALAVALADRLGLDMKTIESGIAKVEPVKHRMSTYELSGALVIDDTYNGNLEGIRAGIDLLKSVSAKRKLYVTPGLVEQGDENKRVHTEIADLISRAKPDVLVLIKNSATNIIRKELNRLGYDGEVMQVNDPLKFYTNLGHILAHGDVVLLQNDWTDNYN